MDILEEVFKDLNQGVGRAHDDQDCFDGDDEEGDDWKTLFDDWKSMDVDWDAFISNMFYDNSTEFWKAALCMSLKYCVIYLKEYK